MNDQAPDQNARPDDHDTVYVDPPGITMRGYAIIGLVGFAGLALVLVVLRAASRPAGQPSVGEGIVPDNWQVSLEHLAAAADLRFIGLEERLDRLSSEKVQAAATSVAPEPLMNGSVDYSIPPPPPVGAEEPPPPAPAAVSVPPEGLSSPS